MAFEVVHDGTAPGEPAENCCFCFVRTRFWHAAKDVACCPGCAQTHEVEEIPEKRVWCEEVDRRFLTVTGPRRPHLTASENGIRMPSSTR